MEYLLLTKSLLNSSSSEDESDKDVKNDRSSDEEDLDLYLLNKEMKAVHPIQNYLTIVQTYTPDEFKSHFRISRTSVEDLIERLRLSTVICKGRPAVPIEKGVLLTIWTLSNQECFRTIADRFNLQRGLAHSVFIKVCKLISDHVNYFIKWPAEGAVHRTIEKFNMVRGPNGFPNVVGCVDGTHILIPGPASDNSYYNRKGTHSIILQGICDSKLRFIDVYCGWPGSSHDGTVWRHSPIFQALTENRHMYVPENCYLLGDTAYYPLKTFLMLPFKDNGHLTDQQKQFNKKLSRTRVLIENAFSRLKGLFRRLRFLNVINMSYTKFIILSCCILHNIAIKDRTLYVEEEDIENVPIENLNIDEGLEDAIAFRNNLMAEIV